MSIPGIDCTNLSGSVAEQPNLVRTVYARAAQANNDLRNAKEATDTAKAALHLQVRKAPGDFGLGKPTENDIEAVILTHASLKPLRDEESTCQLMFDLAVAECKAANSRSQSMSDLIFLTYSRDRQ